MIGHLKIKSPWKQLAVLLAVSVPLLVLVVLNGQSATPVDLSQPNLVQAMKWSQAVSSIAFFFFPAFLYAAFTFRGRQFYFLGLRKAEKTNMYVLAAFCIMLAFPFVFWLGQLNHALPLPESLYNMEKQTGKQLEALLKVNTTGDLIINVIVIALLPAICEELYFRGALQRVLIHLTKSPWAGILLTALVFSTLHFQFLGFFPRMFLGVVLGALYWYSGSLWTSILAHFVNNAVQVIAVSVAPRYISENPQMPVLTAIISGVAVWAIVWYFHRQSTTSWSRVYGVNELNPTNQFIA
ncbi:MAG: type II CAAX endopeptidase family protein [Candidatus Pseudobacter hemicellulosilyticus]|uniref:Type II CAAX endopeptidase family protein n=1 Tax=Candidatus Pseudobacter hemicellulosilyticus TaxID=3121375 RepID=A0AAJ5WYJ2_9BACT|nr:MAG: type II CAAX endopeptidase family protein [Pseudobacter sp.]